MFVDADFSFLRKDGQSNKSSSIDLVASYYSSGSNGKTIHFNVKFLIECKYKSPEKTILLLRDPNVESAPYTLGGTVNSYDWFAPYYLPLNAFEKMEEQYNFIYKAFEFSPSHAVEQSLKHGIEQLRHAIPSLLRREIESQVYGHPEDPRFATFLVKILVSNSPLMVLKDPLSISSIENAEDVSEISDPVHTAIMYSDYGPDYEDHFREAIASQDKKITDSLFDLRRVLERSGKKIDSFSDPAREYNEIANAERFACRQVSSQFFVCNTKGLPSLIDEINEACRLAYKKRTKSHPLEKWRKSMKI